MTFRHPKFFDEIDAGVEAQGRRIAEDVNLPLVSSARAFGEHCGLLVAEAQRIAKRQAQDRMSKRRDAANKIADQAKELRHALFEYESAWGYNPPLGDCITEVMVEPKTGLFSFSAPKAIEVREMAAFLKKIADQYGIEAKDDAYDSISTKGFSSFVGKTLAGAFRKHFGKEPGYTHSYPTDETDGPFMSFARAILKAAGVELTDSQISKALTRKKPRSAG